MYQGRLVAEVPLGRTGDSGGAGIARSARHDTLEILVEMTEAAEELEALLYLFAGERDEPLGTEALDGE